MAFNPYEGRRDYDVEDLLSQIARYKDIHGEECEYVRCDHRNADYSVMDRQQKAYYLYWRDEIARGNCLKSDRGYTKLLICEIINSDTDPVFGMRMLRLLYDNTRMHGMPQSDIAAAMFDYAVLHDMDLPIMWMGKGSVRSFMVTSEIMSFPVRRVSRELMWYLSGGPKLHADGVNDIRHISLFNDSLQAIDRFLMENTGKGVAQTYSEGMTTELYKIFLYLPYGGDRDFQITYEKLRTDGVFGEFMLGLFNYTRKVLCKAIGEKGPATAASFNKEFRAIVDRIAEEGAEDFARVPKSWRGTTRVSMSSKERALVDMGTRLENQYGTAEKPKPIMNVDENAQKQHVSPHLKNDIERNWGVESNEKLEYVPSGFINPDYRSFSEQQRRFYIYWRGQTRKGLYGETDAGYLWLYLCEIINVAADPKEMMGQLVGLYNAYGNFDEERIIGHTGFDYALAHKIPLPDPSMFESNITACMVMDQFLKGAETYPDKNLLLFLSGINDKTVSREFDADCVGITCAALREAELKLEESGTTINDYCNVEKISTSVTLFEGLKYFKEMRKTRFNYMNYVYNGAFDDSLKEIAKNAFSIVRMKRTGKPIKVNKFMAFGMDCKDLMAKVAKDWYEGKEIAEIKERASNLKLDLEAVSGAESALRDVTQMMKSDSEETVETKAEVKTEVKETASSWKGFAEALDDLQKDYLKAVIAGNGKSFLKEHGLIASKFEDSINGIAMDCVGDTIIEDGAIFEDYLSEVTACLQ